MASIDAGLADPSRGACGSGGQGGTAPTPDGVLTPETSWGSEDDPDAPPSPDVLARYQPPFAFTSDHLFVAAWCPAVPLRRAFPGVPFAVVAGRTPLFAWFSRTKAGCATDSQGRWWCEGDPGTTLYHEVTLVAPLWRRAFFVPGIFATSPRSALLARHYYGMPKQAVAMRLWQRGRRFEVSGLDEVCRSWARSRIMGSGRFLARLCRPLWPLWVWPVRFPAGTHVRGVVEAAPRVHLALIPAGQLAVDGGWLPAPARLLPLGLYVPNLRLRLLPP